VKSYCDSDLVEEGFFDMYDIHLHIPAGAVPKDGPSAGIAIAASLTSLAMNRKVRNEVAMTGEITLTGKVLPVGGIKDKVIAAYRAGIRQVILPTLNQKDLEEIPEKVKKRLRFTFVDKVQDGISVALMGGLPCAAVKQGRSRHAGE
jgi:ATP-dependent Lon protease